MRSQQRTSYGFDSDADPRLETRMAAAALQRSFDPDNAAADADEVTRADELPDEVPEPEAVGTRVPDREQVRLVQSLDPAHDRETWRFDRQ
jgi:hypothetical protein